MPRLITETTAFYVWTMLLRSVLFGRLPTEVQGLIIRAAFPLRCVHIRNEAPVCLHYRMGMGNEGVFIAPRKVHLRFCADLDTISVAGKSRTIGNRREVVLSGGWKVSRRRSCLVL